MALHATNNIFVEKRANADGSPGVMMVPSDFRALNSLTEDMSYPTKDVKRIVRWMASKNVFSVADIRDGYYNLKLRKDDRPLTAVRTVLGVLQYGFMAQGLQGACAYFQKMVNGVYGGLRLQDGAEIYNVSAIMSAYLDDLAIGSDSSEQHFRDLREVFERTRGAGLKMKQSKCLFGKWSVQLLRHRVSPGLVRPSEDHTEEFSKYKEPRCSAELLRFIGLVGCFVEHVESAADRLAPLYEVLRGSGYNKKKRKNQKVFLMDWDKRWGKRQKLAFEGLRETLAQPKFLVAPRLLAQEKLVKDASEYGLGAVMLQWEEKMVGYQWRFHQESRKELS